MASILDSSGVIARVIVSRWPLRVAAKNVSVCRSRSTSDHRSSSTAPIRSPVWNMASNFVTQYQAAGLPATVPFLCRAASTSLASSSAL